MNGRSRTQQPASGGVAAGQVVPADSDGTIMSVRNLSVHFRTPAGRVQAVNDVSFDLHRGELVALVGESGSGKTVLASSLLRLLDERVATTSGSIQLLGQEIRQLDDRRMSRLRGRAVSIIFQDPLSALNPLMTVGHQVRESLLVHGVASRASADAAALRLLELVEMPDPPTQLRQYPHQLSGGMNQRAMIAMALACDPVLLVADEPTTALDATTQLQIMNLIRGLARQRHMSVMFVTHDLGVVSEFADRVLIMYAGRLMEDSGKAAFFTGPRHPYSRALLAATPREDRPLRTIPGSIPNLAQLPRGCVFEPRCDLGHGRPDCLTIRPAMIPVGRDTPDRAACHFSDERPPDPPAATGSGGRGSKKRSGALVLTLENLTKDFQIQRRFLGSAHLLRAVDHVSLTISEGETLAVVGESGSGKSTLARAALRLIEPTGGKVIFQNQDITRLRGAPLRRTRARLGLIFQDPDSSLNPLLPSAAVVAEPLNVHHAGDRSHIDRRVTQLFESVGIDPGRRRHYPREFSGGERQRLAIARALALEPALIVCDEPTTMLDVSVQAQILALLKRTQDATGVAYLFVAHDLEVVRQISHRVAVMYSGKIVELCSTAELFRSARHPYTQSLISASSAERDSQQRELAARLVIKPPNRTKGCPYAPTCWKAQDICVETVPTLATLATGHQVACHFPAEPGPPVTPVGWAAVS